MSNSSLTPWRNTLPKTSTNESVGSSSDDEAVLSSSERKMLKHILRGEVDYVRVSEQQTDRPDASADVLAMRFVSGVATLDQLSLSHEFEFKDRSTRRSAVLLLRHESAATLTIVFNGNQPLLAIPTALLQHNTHVLLVRDPKRCFGLAGLPGLGSTAEACVVSLAKLASHLDAQKIYCIGISAGGSTALKLGTDLKVNGMLCFSSPTTLRLDDDPGAELSHYPQLAQLYKTDRSLGIDLADYYRKSTPRPGLLMVYGADHPRDSWLAERIAPVHGAEMVRIDNFSGHKTYPLARQRGMMPSLLDRLFKIEPVSNDL